MNKARFVRRASIGVLSLLGVGTFALALAGFSSRIKAPFRIATPSGALNAAFTTQDQLLDTKDTDQDGIPDAQELKVYRTSPFLEDSDSDGVADRQEVLDGTDPNCPQGRDCRAIVFPSVRDVQKQDLEKNLFEATMAARVGKEGIPGLTDAAAIRNFLKQSGVSEEVLAQFDDATLVQMVQEASPALPSRTEGSVGQARPSTQGGSGGQAGNQGAAANATLPKNPTAQQVRELLKAAGMQADMLKKFDDATLLKLYQDTLKQVGTTK